MREILQRLNKTPGLRGSMVINRDGIVVASDFSVELDETTLGALSSSVLAAIETAVSRLKLGKLARFVVKGNEGQVAIVDAGGALLVVLFQRNVNFGLVNVEIQTAVKEIGRRARL
jgi:hypothetical protein